MRKSVNELKPGTPIRIYPYDSGQVIQGTFVEEGPNFIVLIDHNANFAPTNKEIMLKLDDILEIKIDKNFKWIN